MAPGRPDSPLTARLQRTVAWMDSALAVLSEGVALLDGDSSAVLFATEPFARLVGKERVFLLGAPLGDSLRLVSAAGAPLAPAELPWSAARRGAPPPPEGYRALSSGGLRHLEVLVSDFDWVDAEGRPVKHLVLTVRDVTERRHAEEALLSAKAAADAANAELEAFCYAVAHDLRAPARVMHGLSQVLLDDYAHALDEGGLDSLRLIRNSSARMHALVDDLLTLSRAAREELRRGPVDLSALALEVVAALKASRPDRDVEFAVAAGLRAEGDPALLRLALENLFGNAWKFTGRRAKARIEFAAAEKDGKTVYRVKDDGAGFDMAYAQKLFTPFARLHSFEEFEGTGIGLATVQRIVRRHGGRIWAEGRVGEGAVFYFTLGDG